MEAGVKLAEMEPVLARIARWDYSQARDPLYEFSGFLRSAIAAQQELPQIEARFVRMLEPGAAVTPAARDYACRELSVIGTKASVPALARLLQDRSTADMARYALARIPGPDAAAALRTGGSPAPAEARPAAPSMVRVAAMSSAPVAALAKELESSDADVQAAAIRLLNRKTGAAVTTIFLEHYASLSPMGQYRVLYALADRGDASARKLVRAAVKGSVPEVRVAALGALGKIGDASSVPVLADASVNGTLPEQAAARESLYTLNTAGVDSAIAAGIGSSTGKVRLELIRAAGDRASSEAAEVLMQTAQQSDAEVALAAIRALRNAAGPEHAPALLAAVMKIANAGQRREAALTLGSVMRRARKPDVGPVLAAYRAAPDKQIRLTLLDVMGQVSADEALPLLREGLKDPDAEIARGSILALTAWETSAPLPDLLNAAKSEANPTRRILALRGVIKVVTVPSDRPAEATVAILKDVWPLATQVAEKRAILALLPLYPSPEAMRMAETAAADPAVTKEAKAAAEAIRGLR
jgi:HEAT repeat protein